MVFAPQPLSCSKKKMEKVEDDPGLGIVAELYRCDTPPGGCYTDSPFYLQQLPPKKNRFSLQQLPKKGHFLKETHQNYFFSRFLKETHQNYFFSPKSQKKNRACGALYRCDPPRAIEFPVFQHSSILPLYLGLGGSIIKSAKNCHTAARPCLSGSSGV